MNTSFKDLINLLGTRLQGSLPGEEVQMRMAPPIRKRLSEYDFEKLAPKESSVMVLLYPENGTSKVALIKRKEYKGAHSGQVAFPGGRIEIEDVSKAAAALRETEEEIGVEARAVKVLGELTMLYIPVSNYLVYPFVGFIEEKPKFILHQEEVEGLIEIELGMLRLPEIMGKKEIILSSGMSFITPYYDIKGNIVWGATAMIISELNELLRSI